MSRNICKTEGCTNLQFEELPNCYKHRGKRRTDICNVAGCEKHRYGHFRQCYEHYKSDLSRKSCVKIGCDGGRFGTYSYCRKHFIYYNTNRACAETECENHRYDSSRFCIEHKRMEQRKRSRDKVKTSGWNKKVWLKNLYGLSLDEYNKMLEIQNFQCAICQRDLNLTNRGAHVDHDHVTQKVRDILCPKCNHIIGILEKSDLDQYAEYLERHESSTTLRLAPPAAGDDKVCSAWRHAESGRNDRITSDVMLLMG